MCLRTAADPSGTIETIDKDQIKHDKLALLCVIFDICREDQSQHQQKESWSVTQRMFALNISSLAECTPSGDHKRSMALTIVFYIYLLVF